MLGLSLSRSLFASVARNHAHRDDRTAVRSWAKYDQKPFAAQLHKHLGFSFGLSDRRAA